MNADDLVETACSRAGSDDFGDETWREGLDVLVDSIRTEAALNELGESVMTDQILGLLVNRLEVEQWYARHPEIADQVITAPLFGLGLPRTGSTALELPPGQRSRAAIAAARGRRRSHAHPRRQRRSTPIRVSPRRRWASI